MKVKCPKCEELALWENNPFRPFCSERCKKHDLGSWASEEYSVPLSESKNPGEGRDELINGFSEEEE